MMGTLYIVGVPAGRADELTLRAQRTLEEVALLVTEEGTPAPDLPVGCGLAAPSVPVTDTEAILAALETGDVALLLDERRAGPSVPASGLIRAALEGGFPVVPVPGPSLPVTALILSGLPADSFICLGSLPAQPDERQALLAAVAGERRTLLILASPAHLPDTLACLYGALGDRPLAVVVVSGEGTEMVWRGRLGQAAGQVAARPDWLGCALVIGGARQPTGRWEKARLRAEVRARLEQGLSAREAGRQLSALSGWPRREIYRLAMEVTGNMDNLDDVTAQREPDREGMLNHVAALPHQCRQAWALTRDLKLPPHHQRANKVLIAGMGGSAIGGDLAAAVVADSAPLPILVHRDYGLPAWADEHTLVIGSSYSGDTEETLSAFEAAHERGCPLLAVTTGGRLARLAGEWGVPLLSFHYRSMPRAAVGYLFVSLLGILQALGAVGDLEADLQEGLSLLESWGAELAPDSPVARNRARQLAQALYGRVPVVVGAEVLAPVARRWKCQFNENGKGWAYFEVLPEMDHNALSGLHFPAGAADRLCVLFLTGQGLQPRNRLRLDLTRQILEEQGIACHAVPVPGRSKLAQALAGVQLGDYVSCYLAALYGADPTPIAEIATLKRRMSEGR